jgi:hypothetical protein
MLAHLGERVAEAPGDALVTQLAGMSIQSMALTPMDPELAYDASGQLVKDRLSELNEHRAEIRSLVKRMADFQQQVSHQDWISYKDRFRAFGEEAALRWLVAKYNNPEHLEASR